MASATMIAAVAAGGAIGTVLRYGVSLSVGAGLFGIAGFFAIGLFGALTTFSSFALDAGQLWQKQGMVMAGAYVMASVLLSLLAFGAGFWTVRHSGIWQ